MLGKESNIMADILEAWGGKVASRCHDCGVEEGQLHEWGCAVKLITQHEPWQDWVQQWIYMISDKGRIPWIQYPNVCTRCGKLWPDMFSVPGEEWMQYIEPAMRGKMLCEPCYREIKALIDKAGNDDSQGTGK